jgi:hypothetical protein
LVWVFNFLFGFSIDPLKFICTCLGSLIFSWSVSQATSCSRLWPNFVQFRFDLSRMVLMQRISALRNLSFCL